MDEHRVFGAIPSPQDDRDYIVSVPAMGKLPKSCHLPSVEVRNQGSVGSCVAHAIASAQDMGGDDKHSIKAIYGNRTAGQHTGTGMIPREALKNVQSWGNVPDAMFPGNAEMYAVKAEFDAIKDTLDGEAAYHRINSYARCYTPEDMKVAIANKMPIALTVKWFEGHTVNKDGVMLWGGGAYLGNHEVLITGYDEDYFVIQNSWGKGWGNKGKCLSHATSLMSPNVFVEAWAIDLGCRPKKALPSVIRRTLKRGSRGDDVEVMQSVLIDCGYYLGKSGADGIFGRDTQSAVIAYQSDNGLDPDGIVGKLTWAQLDTEEA